MRRGQFATKLRQKLVNYGFLCMVAAVIALTHYDLLKPAFTCVDDFFTATAKYRWDGVLSASWNMAKGHGRFYHLTSYTLAQIPYLDNGFLLPGIARYTTYLASFTSFFFLVSTLSGSRLTAAACTSLAAGLVESRYSFNSLHALPLWFGTGPIYLWTSLALFVKAQRNVTRSMQTRLCIFSAVLFFLAMLTYEVFVPALPLYGLVAWTESIHNIIDWRECLRRTAKAIVFPLCAVVIYIVMYLAWAFVFPSSYDGSTMSLASPVDMVRPVLLFSLGGVSWESFLRPPTTFSVRALVSASIIFLLCILFLMKDFKKKSIYLGRTIWIGIAIALLWAIFFPNLIFALMPRYREWAIKAPHYMASYYSMFPAIFLLLLIVRGATSIRGLRVFLSIAFSLWVAWAAYNNVENSRLIMQDLAKDDDMFRSLSRASVEETPFLQPLIGLPIRSHSLNTLAGGGTGEYQYWDLLLRCRPNSKMSAFDCTAQQEGKTARVELASLAVKPKELHNNVSSIFYVAIERNTPAIDSSTQYIFGPCDRLARLADECHLNVPATSFYHRRSVHLCYYQLPLCQPQGGSTECKVWITEGNASLVALPPSTCPHHANP